jgi:hypothetical protein
MPVVGLSRSESEKKLVCHVGYLVLSLVHNSPHGKKKATSDFLALYDAIYIGLGYRAVATSQCNRFPQPRGRYRIPEVVLVLDDDADARHISKRTRLLQRKQPYSVCQEHINFRPRLFTTCVLGPQYSVAAVSIATRRIKSTINRLDYCQHN